MSGSTALSCLPHVFSRRRRRLGHLSRRKREDSGTAASTVATLCCDISPLSCSCSPPLGIVEASLSSADAAETSSPQRKVFPPSAATPAADHEDDNTSLSPYSGTLPGIDPCHRCAGLSFFFLGRRCNTNAKPSPFITDSLKKIVRRKRASCPTSSTGDTVPMFWASESAVTSAELAAVPHNDGMNLEKYAVEAPTDGFFFHSELVLPRDAPPVTPSNLEDPAKRKCPSTGTPLSLFMRYFSSPRRRRISSSPGVLEERDGEDEENSTISSPLHAEEIDRELEKMAAPVLGDEDCILRSDLTRFIDCRTLQLMSEDDEHTAQL